MVPEWGSSLSPVTEDPAAKPNCDREWSRPHNPLFCFTLGCMREITVHNTTHSRDRQCSHTSLLSCPMAKVGRVTDQLVILGWVVLWYVVSTAYNSLAKRQASNLANAESMLLLQWATGLLLPLLQPKANISTMATNTMNLVTGSPLRTAVVVVCHFVGCTGVVVGFMKASISFVVLIKASEPVLTSLFKWWVTGTWPCTSMGTFALTTVLVGVCALLVGGDGGISRAGGSWAGGLLSAVAFSLRNVLAASMLNSSTTSSPSTITWLYAGGGAVCSAVCYIPYRLLVSLSQPTVFIRPDYFQLVLAGVAHSTYQLASTHVMTRVSATTHALLNVLKRVFVVVLMAYLGDALTVHRGMACAVITMGALLYAQDKTHRKFQKGVHELRVQHRTLGVVMVLLLAARFYVMAHALEAGDPIPQIHPSVPEMKTTTDLQDTSLSIPHPSVFADTRATTTATSNHLQAANHTLSVALPREAVQHPAPPSVDPEGPKVGSEVEVCHAEGYTLVCTTQPRDPRLILPSTDWFHPPSALCGPKPVSPELRCANLGDEIGALLLHWLTGQPIERRTRGPEHLIVGSVINWQIANYPVISQTVGAYNISVWGTGTKWGVPGVCFDYHAVRGPKTREVVAKFGCHVPEVYGDPALLLPYFFDPRSYTPIDASIDLCVIPHLGDFRDAPWLGRDGIPDLTSRFGSTDVTLDGHGVRVLDIRTPDAGAFLSLLVTCPLVASASLHGLILAEAYHITWSWVQLKRKSEGAFKYHDFFRSVGLDPVKIKPLVTTRQTSVRQLLEHTRPQSRQGILYSAVALLDACPFCRSDVVARIRRLAVAEAAGTAREEI
jgi:hypothetical protein